MPCLSAAVLNLLGGAGLVVAQASVSLTPSAPKPQPVGTSIVWSAAVSTSTSATFWYRFSVAEGGQPPQIVQDFSPASTFTWNPSDHEGTYSIAVSARDNASMEVASASVSYDISARVSAGAPLVTSVSPLVALYSAPPCPEGSSFRVRYWPSAGGKEATTPLTPCTGSTSMNTYVAGMYANTTYTLVSEVLTGSDVVSGPATPFRTGAPDLPVPAVTVYASSRRALAPEQDVVYYGALNAPVFATDLDGNLLWFSYVNVTHPMRPVSGGTFLGSYLSGTLTESTLFELDLASNIVRQTNAARVNEQLAALGVSGTINGFHHDAMKLPNGNYLALAATERVLTDVQGPGAVDVLGDMILVLDPNLQVVWAWDSFAHLDVHRAAVLGETCAQDGSNGCPPIFQAVIANDWLHGNSITLAPDGNIVYSARHQDFVYKIAYENGAGDGHVIWKLGKDGDFTTLSSDPYPWQSHQHDVDFVRGTNRITLFDNGNTRHEETGGNSRGQVLDIDEANRIVTYRVNEDLGEYSFALGSAQALLDGTYYFEAGATAPAFGVELGRSSRGLPVGIRYRVETQGLVYRSFRMRSIYGIQ